MSEDKPFSLDFLLKNLYTAPCVIHIWLISGPIASALANKYSIRVVTIIGSIIASVSFFLSTFAPSLNVLIVTYGVLGGQYSITIIFPLLFFQLQLLQFLYFVCLFLPLLTSFLISVHRKIDFKEDDDKKQPKWLSNFATVNIFLTQHFSLRLQAFYEQVFRSKNPWLLWNQTLSWM